MLAYLFVFIAIIARFMPHPWMFTPVTGALLFFGARGERRQLWIPFALFAMSDVVLTKAVYNYAFGWDHYVTWVWYAAVLLLGTTFLREKASAGRVLGSAVGSSISFFVLSNFAVWAAYEMYPKTWGGLMTSYAMGLPFFRNAIAGDVVFTAAMFATPLLLKLAAGDRAETSAAR